MGWLGLIDLLDRFLKEDAEGGRRGQALVAALLDLAYDEVFLASINDPAGIDVAVRAACATVLGFEVKQKPVTEASALHLAEEAERAGVDRAVLAGSRADASDLLMS